MLLIEISLTCSEKCERLTATSWINDHTIEIVKHHLRHSDKSVKEIADAMGFPNLSFFGKYVKRHTGLSPVAYRNHKPE